MAKFKTALEARSILDDIRVQLKGINYNPDLKRYYENLEGMVSDLSSLEVVARRTGNSKRADRYAKEVDNAISYLEHLILMAKLIQ
jgi:hypothetical protein